MSSNRITNADLDRKLDALLERFSVIEAEHKVAKWILRLLAWPWAARGSLERWPAAPRMTAGNTRRQMGRDANANKTAEDWTLYGLHG